ncbi:hypothetical protein L2E82_12995 [Cichorium intybus]|uniref:Uncharacterized protein n=1 Tax=Cichorium intybus TaxID=13427 RepID=A0ACB9GIW0_CICIN|nr:hypothetical protein L2E82_12995 [Cichorium intybus]
MSKLLNRPKLPNKKHRGIRPKTEAKAKNEVNKRSKLCTLKSPLNSLNRLHFSQISAICSLLSIKVFVCRCRALKNTRENSNLLAIVFSHCHNFHICQFLWIQMKTVSGKIVSMKAVNLSKAANILSNFVTSDNGASQSVSAYLRRASVAFNELACFKKHHTLKKKSKEEASIVSDISHRNLEEAEGKLRKKEKKKKSDGSLGSEDKKKKKRKNAEVDGGENGNLETPQRKKRRKTEADE